MKAKKGSSALKRIRKKIQEKSEKKIKILTISDDPRLPSGVGTQTKYVCEALLESGRFDIVSLGSAIQHQQREPAQIHENWKVIPVESYGNKEIIRSILRAERPDMVWFMTDPRFYEWLWHMEDEIRCHAPLVYYHVWDNYPTPEFNKKFYDSTDVVVSISKLTHDIVTSISPEVEAHYIPHAVDPEIFKKLSEDKVAKFRNESLGDIDPEAKIFFWNGRNAKRKQSGTTIFWFKEFIEKNDIDDAILLMHTNPKDQHGQDLHSILNKLDLKGGSVRFSQQKVDASVLAMMYNMAHCTINISDAEGFGLSCQESLACGTPVIVNKTGGLQDQAINDNKEELGVVIDPCSKAVIGSQQVPYIYEDRISKEDFLSALDDMYNISQKDYEELSNKCIEQVEKNFNFKEFKKNWVNVLTNIKEEYGSWPVESYEKWHLIEL